MINLDEKCWTGTFNAMRHFREDPKKAFKVVNSLLQILDSDDLQGICLYLAAYGKSEHWSILNEFYQIARQWDELSAGEGDDGSQIFGEEEVTNWTRPTVLAFGSKCAGLDSESGRADLAKLIMRGLLIHLRYHLKATMKET